MSGPTDLMGPGEVCAYAGVTRAALKKWKARPDFPKPLTQLGIGPVWYGPEIRAWWRDHRDGGAYRRLAALRRRSSGEPARQIARELGVSDITVRRWIREAEGRDGATALGAADDHE